MLYILNQRIELKGCSDWLLKLRITLLIQFDVPRPGFASKNIAIVTEINELILSFCALLFHCSSFY